MRWGVFSFLWSLVAFSTCVTGQTVIESVDPSSGKPGDPVSLTLSSVEEGAEIKALLGDFEMPITGMNGNVISCVIPENATTDRIHLDIEGELVSLWTPFTITVDTEVMIAPRVLDRFQGAFVSSLFGQTTVDRQSVHIPTPKGEVSFIVAGSDSRDDGLMALSLGNESPVTIGAESSVLALLYMNPLIYDNNPETALQILQNLQSIPATTAAVSHATSLLEKGQDITEDSQLEDYLASAVIEYLAQPAQENIPEADNQMGPLAISPGWPRQDGFVNAVEPFTSDTPRDLETKGYPLNRLETSALPHSRSEAGLPVVSVKFDAARLKSMEDIIRKAIGAKVTLRYNALEWGARLYALDPLADPVSTRTKVESLTGDLSSVYPRITDRPIGAAMVGNKPVLGYIDLPGVVKDLLFAKWFPVLNPPTKIDIPANKPGLYMIRSYSGARFPPQENLVKALPGGVKEDLRMTALNVVMAITEASGIILKGESIIGDREFAKLIITLEQSIGAALFKEHTNGTLNNRVMGVIFFEGLKTFTKEMFFKFFDRIVEKGITAVLPKLAGKFVLKSINVFGKIASAGKLTERILALSNATTLINSNAYLAQSVQSTLAVVGDPWEPSISSFHPTAAHRGATIRINGARFSEVASENIVTFNNLSTSPNNPPAAAKAKVLKATRDSLLVQIPEEAATGFITVTIEDRGSFSTSKLSGRYRSFTIIPDPVITSITPNPPLAGKLMRIEGRHFGPEENKYLEANSVEVLYDDNKKTEPFTVMHNAIVVRAPNSVSGNGVVVRVKGRPSNRIDFSTVLPQEFSKGAIIRVTTLEDNNKADGEVSLREAILLASGGENALGLGRPVTRRTDNAEPGQLFESDFITSPELAGAASVDSIAFQLPLPLPGEKASSVLSLTNELPPLDNQDIYAFPSITIDGNNKIETGLTINGKSGIKITGGDAFKLQNFLGSGILLTGGSSNNSISRMDISGCGGSGVLIQTSAMLNYLWEIGIRNCNTGYHLIGEGVMLNSIGNKTSVSPIEIANNKSFGYLIDGGAQFNLIHPENVINNGEGGIAIVGTPTFGQENETGRGNVIDTGIAFAFPEITQNKGPGVIIQAPFTSARYLNIFDNNGDGLLIETAQSHGSQVYGIRSGYKDHAPEEEHPNTGHGIHVTNGAHDIQIGLNHSTRSDTRFSYDRNYLGGNQLSGLSISGNTTRDIITTMTHAGSVMDWLLRDFHKKPNAQNGIAITEGAQSTTIGGSYRAIDVRIHNHVNGAGILLSGKETRDNIVFNCEIGSNPTNEAGLGNRYGIHLTGGAHSNVIGLRGSQYQVTEEDAIRFYGSSNQIRGNIEAGILLESGVDPLEAILTTELPTKGNVIQNNLIGLADKTSNEVGIWLRGDAYGNRIGGTAEEERNLISYNRKAGILIENVVRGFRGSGRIPNRIIGNTITRQGNSETPSNDPVPDPDYGVGILITEDASGHVIGGEAPGEGNKILRNHTGVYLKSSKRNQIIGNALDRNSIAGIFLNDSSSNIIGPFNEITDNGSGEVAQGGIAVHSGGENSIKGNFIGITAEQDSFPDGNTPDGVFISNSSYNNIGSIGYAGSNVIYGNEGNGITLRGDACTHNRVSSNFIGVPSNPGAFIFSSNRGHGVHMIDGASHNIIGGETQIPVRGRLMSVSTGNVIERNSGAGVKVEGASSTQNTITHNAITNHSGDKGIELASGGNHQIPAPVFSTFDGINVFGTVDLNKVADGSLVQLFTDPDDEGKAPAGEATVRNGRFETSLIMPAFANLTATVTDAVTGDTS